jgi:hypothetical protein
MASGNTDRPSQFGQLEPVEPRSCWSDEARDLTPWVAGEEGLNLLAKALRIELARESTEVPVGPYSADILARDTSDDSLVVIENQLERTNHDHLGKTLTYAAVLGASTVVWIAKSFTDEHRKTIEWLNELAKGDLRIYGVELKVWRIGQSLPAPYFDVVVEPNEVVEEANRARQASEASPLGQLQLEFWTEVRNRLLQSGEFTSVMSPRPQQWMDLALGRSWAHVAVAANSWDKFIYVQLYLAHRVATSVLEQFLPMKEDLEHELGSKLEWNPNPNSRDKVIRLRRPGDITDRTQWPELTDWLAAKAVAFKRVFGPRVKAADISGSAETV